MINAEQFIPVTEVDNDFSKVARMVDETGMVVISENDKPRYVLVDYVEYDEIQKAKKARADLISEATSRLIGENMEALLELAK